MAEAPATGATIRRSAPEISRERRQRWNCHFRGASVSPWLVAAAVVIPTFMEVLDTTIANVALRYIAGGLSAPASDSEWVITSYLAANAIVLPISGWLAMRLGRRNYFLLSIAVFTLASALCGMATSLAVLIAARVLQGLAGGGLQPSSQAILLDAFPPEKQGAAMTIFGVAALWRPSSGQRLAAISPITTAGVGSSISICRSDYLPSPCVVRSSPIRLPHQPAQGHAEGRTERFDTLGLCLLSATMVSWEVLLSKGQEWDWFGDPFGAFNRWWSCLSPAYAALSIASCVLTTRW